MHTPPDSETGTEGESGLEFTTLALLNIKTAWPASHLATRCVNSTELNIVSPKNDLNLWNGLDEGLKVKYKHKSVQEDTQKDLF